MSLTVMSVASSGTNFLLEMLKANGFKAGAAHFKQGQITPKGLVLSPMRAPSKIMETWLRAHRAPPFCGLHNLEFAFRQMNDLYLSSDDLWLLPVDTEDREEYLARMGERLGKKLETRWSKVNSLSDDTPVVQLDLSQIYALDVVRAVYG